MMPQMDPNKCATVDLSQFPTNSSRGVVVVQIVVVKFSSSSALDLLLHVFRMKKEGGRFEAPK